MKFSFKSKFGLIFSFILINANVQILASDNLLSIIELGDQFYKYENYDVAITEYQRYIYFSGKDPYKFYAYYKAGLAYKKLNKTNNSRGLFKKSIQLAPDQELKNYIRYQLAISLLAQKHYDLAIMEFLKLSHSKNVKEFADISKLLLGLTFTYQHNWLKAKQQFANFNNSNISNSEIGEHMRQIDLKIDQMIEKPEKKSLATAKWLSTFLPGLGQIYTENILIGLNALGLNSLTTYYLIHTIEIANYRDVALIFTIIWLRYYQGNRENAEILAKDANTEFYNNAVKNISLNALKVINNLSDKSTEIDLNFLKNYQIN